MTRSHSDLTSEAETLLAAITPGEWRVIECSGLHEFMVASDEWTVAEMCGERAQSQAHAQFIAAAPRLVRALLSELSRLRDDRDCEKRLRKDSDDRAAAVEEALATLREERDKLVERAADIAVVLGHYLDDAMSAARSALKAKEEAEADASALRLKLAEAERCYALMEANVVEVTTEAAALLSALNRVDDVIVAGQACRSEAEFARWVHASQQARPIADLLKDRS